MMYKVSIIGAGNIAAFYDTPKSKDILTHSHAIVCSKKLDLVGVYDIENTKALRASNMWGGQVFDTMDDALENADIICICVPDEGHYRVLKKCLNYGNLKAIIVEKPLVRTCYEACEISTLIKDCGIPIFLNYSRRYMKEFGDIKEWIKNDAGDLLCGNCYYGKGTLHNASHMIDVLEYFDGRVRVESAVFEIVDWINSDPSIEFVLLINGARVIFRPVDCNIATIFEFDLIFSNGRVKYSAEKSIIEYYKLDLSDKSGNEKQFKLMKTVSIDSSSAMNGLYSNLIEVLEKGGKPNCSFDEGIRVLRIVDEIYEHKRS